MTILEIIGNLSVWWFPNHFSQSHYGKHHKSGKHSCTLISLIVADKVSKEVHGFQKSSEQLPARSIEIFGDAIDEGNGVYERVISTMRTQMPSKNLTIPDALNALRTQDHLDFCLQEWFYTQMPGDPQKVLYTRNVAWRLSEVFKFSMDLFQEVRGRETPRFLYSAVIADSRTVIFIFEFSTSVIGFYDSHQHGVHAGATVAQCPFENIYELTYWYVSMLKRVYSSQPTVYEVSFLTKCTHRLPHVRCSFKPSKG